MNYKDLISKAIGEILEKSVALRESMFILELHKGNVSVESWQYFEMKKGESGLVSERITCAQFSLLGMPSLTEHLHTRTCMYCKDVLMQLDKEVLVWKLIHAMETFSGR